MLCCQLPNPGRPWSFEKVGETYGFVLRNRGVSVIAVLPSTFDHVLDVLRSCFWMRSPGIARPYKQSIEDSKTEHIFDSTNVTIGESG
jgi:hypothetical protein